MSPCWPKPTRGLKLTSAYIITLFDRNGKEACVSVVESSEHISGEIARLATWLGERFQFATIRNWQRVNSGGPLQGWYMRHEFPWRG